MAKSPRPDLSKLVAAGRAAHKAGDLALARRCYEQALRLAPDHAPSLHLLGVVTDAEGRPEHAIRLIRRALPALDGQANVHNNLANALRHAGQVAAALRHYLRAVELDPKSAKAHHNLGVLLAAPGPDEDLGSAREHLRRAAALEPGLAEPWLELARLARREGKLPAAIELYRKALELRPDDVAALLDLGAAYQLSLQVDKALPLVARAAKLAPDLALAHFNHAQALAELGRRDEAEAAHLRVLALQPEAIHSRLAVAKAQRDRCEWSTWSADAASFAALPATAIAQAPSPFLLNLFPVPMATHLAVARAQARHLEERVHELGGRLEPRPPTPKARLRVGFLSADLRHHPVGHLCHEMFARFDRSRVEPFAYSLVPVDDEVTAAVRAGCVGFRSCARLDDRAIARQIADDGVDVLVDLTGYTTYSRPAILALRPAPLQVQHMGYVDTMGAPFIDFQVVDGQVVGPAQRPFFDERLIVLPHCLFPVSPAGRLGATSSKPTRREAGLPDGAPVFCSMNGPAKLDPPTFDAWMEILGRVPGAVLWLYDGDEPRLPANLRAEAAARGIAPARLVFASRLPWPEHLARYALADLFLDCFTYNAGATAVDALRQGLPVLTLPGEAPLSRMGASIAAAAGLADFVATSPAHYVDLAVAHASDPTWRRELASRTAAARESSPLFDLETWVRHYEAGLAAAWERLCGGGIGDVSIPIP